MLDEKRITRRFLAPYLRNTDVQWGRINTSDLPMMDFDEADRVTYSLRRGDLLICEGGEIGRTAIWNDQLQDCFYQKALHRLRPRTGLDYPGYFVYVMRHATAIGLFASQVAKSTIDHLPAERLRGFRYPSPPMLTQRAIASYLDRETVRIDELLGSKERLLELLAEKRLTLITRAVTRGAGLKAKLKDSGIPWLGEIPEHWEIERSKWLFTERDERSTTGEEEMLTVSHITGVTPRSEKTVNMFEAESNEGCKLCQEGDLVINTLWAWMGAMGTTRVTGMVSPAYNVYTPGERILPDYVDALVRTPVFAQEAIRFSKGVWSSRLRLYPEGLYEISLPVPPLSEQREIVAHIATETAKLDALRASAERSIRLLKERRSALISAAVTGKIAIPQPID